MYGRVYDAARDRFTMNVTIKASVRTQSARIAKNVKICHPLATHLSLLNVTNNPEHVGSSDNLG
jgi:hypothetical protein